MCDVPVFLRQNPIRGKVMKLEILGTGCVKCKKLEELARETVKELGIDAEVVKVQDIKAIMAYGVMVTPALVVDGEVKVAGKIPTRDEIKKWIGAK
jgi:small redox-active disulfide protein 2